MFDSKQSIAEWRRQMLIAGVKNPNVLDELEGHLREDVEQQVQSGLSVEQAFQAAVQRIGHPAALRKEFAKAGTTKATRLGRFKHALLQFIGVSPQSRCDFAADARESLELGGKEALGFHHHFVGTEHVLLGLLELKPGVVRGVLGRMGVEPQAVRNEIEKIVGFGPGQLVNHKPAYTPRAKKALWIADSEARALKQKEIRAEHIFLGLLREGSGVAALVLNSLGVNVQKARAAVLEELGRGRPGA